MTTTDNYTASTSLTAYYRSRTERSPARLWANEKFLHDAADVGILSFFEGAGPNPTLLTGYDAEKIWLRTSSGVTTTKGDVLVYSGTGATSSESNWVPLTPALYQAYLSSVVTRYVDTRDYGAIADGTDHLLSEEYASLAAAQAVYPRATSLSQSIDAMAIQKAIDVVGVAGGGRVHLGGGTHVVNELSPVVIHYNGVMIDGCGLEIKATDYDYPVFVVGSLTDSTKKPADVTFANIRFRQTETLANPANTTTVSGAVTLTKRHTSAAIFHAHGDRLKILNCRFQNHLYGLSYYNWSDLVTASEGLDVIGCEFDGCNFGGFIASAVNDVRWHNNVARDTANIIDFLGDGSIDPPHQIYITGGVEFQSICQRVSVVGNTDYSNGGITGSSYKFKGVNGFNISGNLSVSTTGGIELGYCTDGIVSGNAVRDLIEDSVSTISQGALRTYGCSNVEIDGFFVEMTGSGTQAVAMAPLAKTDVTPEPSDNVLNTDMILSNIVVDYKTGNTSPQAPFYLDTCQRVTILNPVIKRASGINQYLFNIQDNDATQNTDDVRIITPTIRAESGDTYRSYGVFVESGSLNVRIVVDEARLINVDSKDSNFVSDAGTGTIFHRYAGFSNAGGKAVSGRTWDLLSTHVHAFESSSDTLIEIVSGNANTGALRFGDVDATARGRVDYDHSTDTMTLHTNGSRRLSLSVNGLDTFLQSATAANIASAAHAINTTNKLAGKIVFDTTNSRIMIATGATATSAWAIADGSATVTPS